MMIDLSVKVAASAGFCSGAVLGANIVTRTELLNRGARLTTLGPFERILFCAGAKIILSAALFFILISAAMLLVGLGIMHIGGIHGLNDRTRLPFGIALITGVSAAKYLRYLYWKSPR